MLSALASNALTAKVHALRSRRITDEQYRELLTRKSVSEICSYLQSATRYAEVLAGVQAHTIHRRQLENLIRELRFVEYGRLMAYTAVTGESFYDYFIIAAEIEQILQFIRFLIEGDPAQYGLQYPQYLKKYFRLKLDGLAAARSFSELLTALDGTDYKKWLEPCTPSDGVRIDYMDCDIALFTNYYEKINHIISRHFKGELEKELSGLFELTKELRNIRNIYRVKRYFPDTHHEELKSSLLPMIDRVSHRYIVKLAEAPSAEAFMHELNSTRIGRYFSRSEAEDIEHRENTIRSLRMIEKLYFRSEAPIAFTAYMTLSEIEVSNLITIIESKYYAVSPEETRSMLVFGRD
ncbi:MAG: V-type ATPase subunit [Oscillospiraceae bacterium]|jgi:V/A-type H+-transporting ATPase subunit C|nr:V-type ATPase subunit [Oscillospiraceae bacterium]